MEEGSDGERTVVQAAGDKGQERPGRQVHVSIALLVAPYNTSSLSCCLNRGRKRGSDVAKEGGKEGTTVAQATGPLGQERRGRRGNVSTALLSASSNISAGRKRAWGVVKKRLREGGTDRRQWYRRLALKAKINLAVKFKSALLFLPLLTGTLHSGPVPWWEGREGSMGLWTTD